MGYPRKATGDQGEEIVRSQLVDASCFGLFMLIGAFTGFSCFSPVVGHGPPHDLYDALWGVPVGLIAGGALWKWIAWFRDS